MNPLRNNLVPRPGIHVENNPPHAVFKDGRWRNIRYKPGMTEWEKWETYEEQKRIIERMDYTLSNLQAGYS